MFIYLQNDKPTSWVGLLYDRDNTSNDDDDFNEGSSKYKSTCQRVVYTRMWDLEL